MFAARRRDAQARFLGHRAVQSACEPGLRVRVQSAFDLQVALLELQPEQITLMKPAADAHLLIANAKRGICLHLVPVTRYSGSLPPDDDFMRETFVH